MPKRTRVDSETARVTCPLCLGGPFGTDGALCPNCFGKGTVPLSVGEELAALIKRVRSQHQGHDPEGIDRTLAAVISLNYNITRKG